MGAKWKSIHQEERHITTPSNKNRTGLNGTQIINYSSALKLRIIGRFFYPPKIGFKLSSAKYYLSSIIRIMLILVNNKTLTLRLFTHILHTHNYNTHENFKLHICSNIFCRIFVLHAAYTLVNIMCTSTAFDCTCTIILSNNRVLLGNTKFTSVNTVVINCINLFILLEFYVNINDYYYFLIKLWL